jgi:hypothetical protein
MDSPSPGASAPSPSAPAPKWKPIGRIERRVIGVLIEKAKTTPAGYPMSLNSVVTGCNQKNNRYPLMSLTEEQVSASLERLRHLGAAAEVHAGGRVPKYRHYMYEWLGVDKFEIAVMTELLLRGAQTIGELRGRAARMESIDSVAALGPVLDGLIAKGLVVELSPPGRGQTVTHGLYLPEEMDKVRRSATGAPAPPASESVPRTAAPDRSPAADAPPYGMSPAGAASRSSEEVAALRSEVRLLRDELARLRKDVDDLWANVRT